MTVKEFAEKMKMRILTGETGSDREVTGVYVCDLLSWVMSHANRGDAWITVLTNLNVAAVAVLTEVSCVIVPEGIRVDEATVERAVREGFAILSSDISAYSICCESDKLI